MCEEIINIYDRETRIVMGEEIRGTISKNKGEEYDKNWIRLLAFQRGNIGLVIHYDIVW